MFIPDPGFPDPDFYTLRIPVPGSRILDRTIATNDERGKIFVVIHFFLATNISYKIENYSISDR